MAMELNRSTPSVTQIKYEKTSCYFCNEWLEAQSFSQHLIHCGQVLEKCPNSCSSYIQRKRLRSHLKECPKKAKYVNGNENRDSNSLESWSDEAVNRMFVLEQDVGALRSVLNEEIRQRLHLITDVGSLRKHNQLSDDWTKNASSAFENLQKCIHDETTQRCSDMETCQNDVRFCFDMNQDLKRELQLEIETVQKQISELAFDLSHGIARLTEHIARLEKGLEQREKSVRLKLKQIDEAIDAISKDLTSKFVSNSELSTKQITLDFEVKSMKNIVCNTEEKCDKLERMVFNFDKAMHQTQQNLADVDGHLSYHRKLSAIQNTRGHLIWRIKDYTTKLTDSKQYDMILHSPIFCNKPFGYTLRMDVHLNGIGSWKGRNLIACINVISGDYDPLLPWPCLLKADLIIRDQNEDQTRAEDYVKTVVVRRKSDNFNTNQYFHIPHKIVESQNFLKNDSLFFEIRIHRNKSTL